MSETVDNEIRDEVMANILAKPPNQVCFDCGSKAPKWSSPYLGIVICYECAAKHRSYGTHISFVRSVDLDKWNRKQLKSLELTGNSFTKERFNDLGVPLIGGNYDYNNSMVLKVRQEIAEKVRESLKPDDYKKVEDKKKEVDEFENININNEEIKDEEKEKEKKKEKNDKKKKKDTNEGGFIKLTDYNLNLLKHKNYIKLQIKNNKMLDFKIKNFIKKCEEKEKNNLKTSTVKMNYSLNEDSFKNQNENSYFGNNNLGFLVHPHKRRIKTGNKPKAKIWSFPLIKPFETKSQTLSINIYLKNL